MNGKPKLLIGFCLVLLLLGLGFFFRSLYSYTQADEIADYLKPVLDDCSEYQSSGEFSRYYRCLGNNIGNLNVESDRFMDNYRLKRQLESKQTQNIVFSILIILASAAGLYYIIYKYEEEEK
tara:strand:+ start:734 stop:1099 length:366 start_codon:yes stop_codon:yes gene_type:complete